MIEMTCPHCQHAFRGVDAVFRGRVTGPTRHRALTRCPKCRGEVAADLTISRVDTSSPTAADDVLRATPPEGDSVRS